LSRFSRDGLHYTLIGNSSNSHLNCIRNYVLLDQFHCFCTVSLFSLKTTNNVIPVQFDQNHSGCVICVS
jgi:hypothetical protein